MNIYFVCTGNTCRSPMAAAIVASKNVPTISVKSAGISAFSGEAMSRHAQATLAARNIPTEHASNQINLEDINGADLILTMTNAHKKWLVENYAHAANKIYTLHEYVTPSQMRDVVDPFGGDLTTYEQTYTDLAQSIEKLLLALTKED